MKKLIWLCCICWPNEVCNYVSIVNCLLVLNKKNQFRSKNTKQKKLLKIYILTGRVLRSQTAFM